MRQTPAVVILLQPRYRVLTPVPGGLGADRVRALVAEAVGAQQQVPHWRFGLGAEADPGQRGGDPGGARGAEVLLAQVQTAVRQCRAGAEVDPGRGRGSGAQPGEQGGEFGAHQAASR